jgi:hypothetical protein
MIWKVDYQIANSAGNLVLHLIGNLKTYIGQQMGGFDYSRNREAEFVNKDIPLENLMSEIDETIKIVNLSLDKIKGNDHSQHHSHIIWSAPMSIEYTLIQLCCHLSYHLGQINYHRRIMDRDI